VKRKDEAIAALRAERSRTQRCVLTRGGKDEGADGAPKKEYSEIRWLDTEVHGHD